MSTTQPTELERFRDFVHGKIASGETTLSPEDTVGLFRQAEMDAELPIHPIPRSRVNTVQVKCRFRGIRQPLPYELDEEVVEAEENTEP